MKRSAFLFVWAALLSACAQNAPLYRPAHDLGPLFHEVQLARVFPDSKTFVDAVPRMAPGDISSRFAQERTHSAFDLGAFVRQYFVLPGSPSAREQSADTVSMEQHLLALWPILARPPDSARAFSSLIPLPYPYIVPGGRFREIYYWDSYFTMLGLIQAGRLAMTRSMLDNFAYLINRFGHIPNGNRTYYLSRSQPPYFGAMVALYLQHADTMSALQYLAPLEKEYAFWMHGERAVKLANDVVLNRYWDDLPEPRPESYREDYTLAQSVPAAQRAQLYRNIRASAESGWDFSSRWMRDPHDLRTLETTELLPVDLNSLLYRTELTIAELRAFRNHGDDARAAESYREAAVRRRNALLRLAYDSTDGFFYDVRWRSLERVRDRPSLAAAAPLYFGLATSQQAARVLERLQREFLRAGGFVTTLIGSGQQWDAPNGWAPLQWLAIAGARRYGDSALADSASARWLRLNRSVYRATGKMMEKYDVVDLGRRAGGGEYPGQDGFGWTNGVALCLSDRNCQLTLGP